ncbi:MAG: fibronectin type III domain-containing protein [Thermodesulfobacteriota bacterium]
MKKSDRYRSVQSKPGRAIGYFTFLSILLTIFLFLPFQQGQCGEVSLAWDPNSEPDLAGYVIYYGTASQNYQTNIDVGNVTTYTVPGLQTGITYYLAATAYNTQGLESGYSNEVVYTVPGCTYTISPSSASFSVSGGSGSVLVETQAGCNWGTSSAASWVTVNTGSGTGTGTMTYSVSTNSGGSRMASLTVAGNVFTITQAGQSTYTITATAGSGGTITPSGSVTVQAGGSRSFSIAPASGYTIASVTVNGASQGAISSYTFSNVNANQSISATFSAIPNYTLTVSKTGTGSGTVTNSPTGSSFAPGTVVTLTAAADSNSVFSGWSGGCTGTASTCQVTMSANVSVTASFTLKTYTITATAGSGGTITPSGSVTVQAGGSRSFSISPSSGYSISSVTVNGVSQGAISSYAFSNVNANQSISVAFTTIPNYTLSVSKSGTGSGTVTNSPVGSSFAPGTVVTLSAVADSSSAFSGWSGGCTGTASTCQVTMNANVSVSAGFALKTYTITATAGSGGTITPSGTVTVQSGGSRSFSISPSSGYSISSVTVNGVSQGAITSYAFSNVNANQSISVAFTTIPNYTLTLSKSGTGNGTVTNSPTGSSFAPGTVVTLTAAADSNSVFSGWSGGCTGTASTCQVTMNANVSVSAGFTLKTYTITATAGTGGTITPSGSLTVQAGGSQSFTIVPNTGYRISAVVVDGMPWKTVSSYTFSKVSSNHTITATFRSKLRFLPRSDVETGKKGNVNIIYPMLKEEGGRVEAIGKNETTAFQYPPSSTTGTALGSGLGSDRKGISNLSALPLASVSKASAAVIRTNDFSGLRNSYPSGSPWSGGPGNPVEISINGNDLTTPATVSSPVETRTGPNSALEAVSEENRRFQKRNSHRETIAVWTKKGIIYTDLAALADFSCREWEIDGTKDLNNDNQTDILWKCRTAER